MQDNGNGGTAMLRRICLFLLVAILLSSFSACGEKAPASAAPVETLVTDPITLVDEDALVVRVLKIEPENEAGYTVSIMVWNRTDMDLKYFFGQLAINDLSYGESFQLDVKSTQKSLLRISLDVEKLNSFNITKVTKMDFRFYAKSSDALYDDLYFEQKLAFFPLGEAAYKTYQRTPEKTDVPLIDNAYCKVIFVDGFANDTDLFCTLYIESKSDKNLILVGEKLLVNNTDPLYQELSIPADSKSYKTVLLSKDVMKVADFEAIQSLSGDIKIYDSAHIADGPFDTTSISIP